MERFGCFWSELKTVPNLLREYKINIFKDTTNVTKVLQM